MEYLSRCSVYSGNFPVGQTKIALSFTVQPKIQGRSQYEANRDTCLSHFFRFLIHFFRLRWYWRLEWRFSNRPISKQLEVHDKICSFTNLQIYKFSFGEQAKFRLQGKFCGKITTTNGSNCNCGLRKHSLRYANLTVCDLKFRLRNYRKSHTLCLVCFNHASLLIKIWARESCRECTQVSGHTLALVWQALNTPFYVTAMTQTKQLRNTLHKLLHNVSLPWPFKPRYENAYSPYCSPYISYGTSKENLSKMTRHLILGDCFLYSHHLNVCKEKFHFRHC